MLQKGFATDYTSFTVDGAAWLVDNRPEVQLVVSSVLVALGTSAAMPCNCRRGTSVTCASSNLCLPASAGY